MIPAPLLGAHKCNGSRAKRVRVVSVDLVLGAGADEF